jgi:hypothetical protein
MGRGKKNKGYVIIEGDGDPCPRCGEPTQIREHAWLGAKHYAQPYYFTRWFYCVNDACAVSLHMAERYKVHNEHAKAKEVKEAVSRGEVIWGDTWGNVGVDMNVLPWE